MMYRLGFMNVFLLNIYTSISKKGMHTKSIYILYIIYIIYNIYNVYIYIYNVYVYISFQISFACVAF